MSEVAAFREYRLDLKTPSQTKRIQKEISKLVQKAISPNMCEVTTKTHENDPTSLVVSMKCVDGRAVHYADVRSMFKILQVCEQSDIPHRVGDLEIVTDF